MRLYLMRHGIAVDREDPQCPPDPQRFLTPRGVARTRAVAEGLLALGIKPAVMVSSPYVRAMQTAEIACEVLGLSDQNIRQSDALKPMAEGAAFFRELARFSSEEVMCFGHAPNLDLVIAHALGCARPVTELKKAGVACIEIETPKAGLGMLLWVLPPRVLRRMD